ncbi:MAG: thymidine phosphorylase, partial [Planctomycetia bacterium]|nr:thymidine phosphorylase [Planctomycetia bacterium]
MLIPELIRKKREGFTLSESELKSFVTGAAKGTWPEYQLSAMLMAIFFEGMTTRETSNFTQLMASSGKILSWGDLPGPVIDKHSTGGVGDKTSIILGPLAAACGVYVPMISGRGLGHTGGTLDKLESIPGFNVRLDLNSFDKILRTLGIAMIGQTSEIAPADRILYSLRDVTATVESIPLITASILSKKIAEGIQGLIMDVKTGMGAFMPELNQARKLAKSIVNTAQKSGIRCQAIITNMDSPLGYKIGNTLEIQECIEILKGNGPQDTLELSIHLAAKMVLLGGIRSDIHQAIALVRNKLTSGEGLAKFEALIEAQGGDPRVIDNPNLLEISSQTFEVKASESGWLNAIDASKLGWAACYLG